ncbi:MAG: methyltransferase domain-containing protein [Verrucomicrobia bacterium]|nr:methyltransferase domain-containing protein [Verrucomicrobiota bacterium]
MQEPNAGDNIAAGNANWRFDGDTVKTFEDHVSKSVPFYGVGHKLVLALSDFFVQRESRIFEMGCSTGILSHALAERAAPKDARVTGVDIVPDMVAFAEKKCRRENLGFVCADILDVDMSGADLIVPCCVMQSIPQLRRERLIDRMCADFNWDGGLVVFQTACGG